jgi:predicted RNA-binding Zn-ribbon protein involved in translation (DUF1610 family)
MPNRGIAGGFVAQEANEADRVPCPKCGVVMQLAAVIPHATDRRMAKHTYLCASCNQTRNYMLPANSAADRAV